MIRPARPDDGAALGKLFVGSDLVDLDWTRPGIADWWLVAEHDGELIGAIQVSCSQPIGHIDQLIVAPRARGFTVANDLRRAAEAALRAHGVQAVTSTIRARAGWRRIVERWGWQQAPDAVVLMRKDLR